jgi:hypothetical protein
MRIHTVAFQFYFKHIVTTPQLQVYNTEIKKTATLIYNLFSCNNSESIELNKNFPLLNTPSMIDH